MVHSNIVTFYFLRMMYTYATSFWWIFDKSIYYLLVIQIRRPEEAASRGPGHSHSEDLSGVEMSHTLPADEKKPNRDGCLVQEICGESPRHFWAVITMLFFANICYVLNCVVIFLHTSSSEWPREMGALLVPFLKTRKLSHWAVK